MTNYLDKDGLKKFWDITKGKYSAIGHNHSMIDSLDKRSTALTPTSYNRGIYPVFMGNNVDGLNDGGEYHGILHWRSYSWGTDMTGVKPFQIAYTANGRLWTRLAKSSTDWDTWYKIARTNDIPTKLSQLSDDVVKGKYLPMSGGTLTGNLGIGTAADTSYKLKVNGSVQCVGNLLVNSNTECQGNLNVKAIFRSVGASTLDSTLTVGGAATLNSSLTVKGATTVQGLTVNDNISVKNGKYLSALNSGNSHYAKYTSDGIQFTTKLNDTAKTLAFPSKGGTIALAEDVEGRYLPIEGGEYKNSYGDTYSIQPGNLSFEAYKDSYGEYSLIQCGTEGNVASMGLGSCDNNGLYSSAVIVSTGELYLSNYDNSRKLPTLMMNARKITLSKTATTEGEDETIATITIPEKTGTIALDVDLAKYLPLTGGTITGIITAKSNVLCEGTFLKKNGANGSAILSVTNTSSVLNVPMSMSKTLKVTGNVGIGTDADAAYKLKVNGTAYFSGDATVNGNLQVAGEIHNGNFYTDVEGRIYTTSLALIYGSNIRTWDDNGKERNFNLQKAIELGVFS